MGHRFLDLAFSSPDQIELMLILCRLIEFSISYEPSHVFDFPDHAAICSPFLLGFFLFLFGLPHASGTGFNGAYVSTLNIHFNIQKTFGTWLFGALRSKIFEICTFEHD